MDREEAHLTRRQRAGAKPLGQASQLGGFRELARIPDGLGLDERIRFKKLAALEPLEAECKMADEHPRVVVVERSKAPIQLPQ